MSNENIDKKLLEALQHLKLYALSLTGNEDNANDLLQETSVKILCNVNSYTIDNNFKGWTATIMHNLFVGECKRKERYFTVSDNTFFEQHYYDHRIDLYEIINAIKRLPIEQKQVFALFAIGYSYQEIADKLVIPIGTVKSRIHLARVKLQRTLAEYA